MRLLVLVALASALAASAYAGAPAGAWTQKSDVKELTAVSKLNISPSRPAGGMVVGTLGSGASTTYTTLQTEYVPLQTRRAMALVIRADGGFTWTIDKSRMASMQRPDCTVTIQEEKTGRVRVEGDKLVFDVTGGVQSSRDSCDPSKVSRGVKAPASESYSYRIAGGALILSGPGGINWTFNRG